MPNLVLPVIEVPRLATDRLALRGHTLQDFDDSAAMWAHPRVTRHIGGRPATREEAWARLTRYVGHWALTGFGYWVVAERASGRFVGEVGMADFRREMEPSVEGTPEVGWVLAPWAHGRGYATEAVRAVLAWSDALFATTVCLIDPGNAESIRVAKKCGYVERQYATYKGAETIIYDRGARGGARDGKRESPSSLT